MWIIWIFLNIIHSFLYFLGGYLPKYRRISHENHTFTLLSHCFRTLVHKVITSENSQQLVTLWSDSNLLHPMHLCCRYFPSPKQNRAKNSQKKLSKRNLRKSVFRWEIRVFFWPCESLIGGIEQPVTVKVRG